MKRSTMHQIAGVLVEAGRSDLAEELTVTGKGGKHGKGGKKKGWGFGKSTKKKKKGPGMGSGRKKKGGLGYGKGPY